MYYSYKKYGLKPIAGPYETRCEAKPYGAKTGMKCRICGEYSGGNSICRTCIVYAFSVKEGRK